MASYREAFPSRFWKADDVQEPKDLEIESVGYEDVGAGQRQESKLVVHFNAQVKALVLNLINAETIAEIVGTDDYEQWASHRIRLFATKTEFQGKRVPCVRVMEPADRARGPRNAGATPASGSDPPTSEPPAWVTESDEAVT